MSGAVGVLAATAAVVGSLTVIFVGARKAFRAVVHGVTTVINWGKRLEAAVEDVPKLREDLRQGRIDLEKRITDEVASLRQENTEQHAESRARLEAIEQHLTMPKRRTA